MGAIRRRTILGCEGQSKASSSRILRLSVVHIVKYLELYRVDRISEVLRESDSTLVVSGKTPDGLDVELRVLPVEDGLSAEMYFDGKYFDCWFVSRDRVVSDRELPEVVGWAVEALLTQRFGVEV